MANPFLAVLITILVVSAILYTFRTLEKERKDKELKQKLLARGDVFCVDCTQCMPDELLGVNFARCRRTEQLAPDLDGKFLVAGDKQKPRYDYAFCSIQRGFDLDEYCGPLGRFFEKTGTTVEYTE